MMVMKKGKIRICCVSNRTHSPAFTVSLATMMASCSTDGAHFERIGLTMMPWRSCVAMAREQGVQIAQTSEATHILFVDDDSVFPPDALQRLFQRGKRIIGANFVRKEIPATWVTKDLDDKELSSNGRTGIEIVSRLGFGLTLIAMEVFDAIPLPWFSNSWSEDRGHMTEDTWFCNRAHVNGYDLWVDHDLSLQCFHAGELLYGPAHTGEVYVPS